MLFFNAQDELWFQSIIKKHTKKQPTTKQLLKRNTLFQFSEISLITLKSLFAVICGSAFINLAKQQVHEWKNQRGRNAEWKDKIWLKRNLSRCVFHESVSQHNMAE